MVDSALLAASVAAVRDAVTRIRSTLPASADAFAADRTAREVVVLNLFVALQECLRLASHWVADEGWDVPATYRETFLALAEHGVVEPGLAERLAGAIGLRNLIGHRYADLDWREVHRVAADDLDDLLDFCSALARRARG